MTERIENILEQLEKDEQIISYLKTAYKNKQRRKNRFPPLFIIFSTGMPSPCSGR